MVGFVMWGLVLVFFLIGHLVLMFLLMDKNVFFDSSCRREVMSCVSEAFLELVPFILGHDTNVCRIWVRMRHASRGGAFELAHPTAPLVAAPTSAAASAVSGVSSSIMVVEETMCSIDDVLDSESAFFSKLFTRHHTLMFVGLLFVLFAFCVFVCNLVLFCVRVASHFHTFLVPPNLATGPRWRVARDMTVTCDAVHFPLVPPALCARYSFVRLEAGKQTLSATLMDT
mmetsp:Transcript_7880/g.18233  ORF Transcript_7880/g.18233 Transcript_7880/m.18233 type:complete len:228 (+) Transcript_7880:635-1318(+)